MRTLELNKTYWGFSNIEEVEEKIFNYLDATYAWDYNTDDWANEGFPRWTFSGLPDGDILTRHVRDCIEELEIGSMSFSDEEDRIEQLRKYAHEIVASITIGSETKYMPLDDNS